MWTLRWAKFALGDLRRLTGYPFEPRDFVGRALDMLTEHWPAVEAVAMALLDQGRVEGERVEEIVVEAMADRFDAMRPLARKTKASR